MADASRARGKLRDAMNEVVEAGYHEQVHINLKGLQFDIDVDSNLILTIPARAVEYEQLRSFMEQFDFTPRESDELTDEFLSLIRHKQVMAFLKNRIR